MQIMMKMSNKNMKQTEAQLSITKNRQVRSGVACDSSTERCELGINKVYHMSSIFIME